MFSSNRTCFVFEKENSTKISIQIICTIPLTNVSRQFNLLRPMDETVSQTIHRLTSNLERAMIKENKLFKHRREQQTTTKTCNTEKQIITEIQLFDNSNQLIDENQINSQVWPNCRRLSINGEIYHIEYNAPEKILTNTITTAFAEIDYGHYEFSLCDWFVTDDLTQWTHVHRGQFYTFHDENVNKFVRFVCLPRNESLREGVPAEVVSKTRIMPCPIDLPMSTRHELTKEYLPKDSNTIRLVTYNILANGYTQSAECNAKIYPHCSPEYLEHDYRKALLLKEILGYHADIIALQECDASFYQRELSLVFKKDGYLGNMIIKSQSLREGAAILYQSERFRAIDSHDVKISDYLQNSEHLKHICHRCSLLPEINTNLLERNTVLQILALERREETNEIFLICNTHLYYHPRADLIRCLQAMIALERIKEIKQFYEKQNKNVSIIWCGDFNANVTSLSFHLVHTGGLLTDINHRSYDENYAKLIENFDYKSAIELSTYSNYAYTTYAIYFHDVIDHIFYETKKFKLKRSIPMPTHEQVTEFTAIPSCKIPTDHLAVVLDLEILKSN